MLLEFELTGEITVRNLKRLVIVFSLVFLLVGCNDQKIIETLGLMSVMCFDKATDSVEGNMLVTSTFPSITEESNRKETTIDTIAFSKKDAERKLAAKTEQEIVNGQIRSLIFSEDFAADGINQIIHSVERDQEIGSQVKVVISEGEASAILEAIPTESTGNYVDKMLRKESDQFNIPYLDIHYFSRDMHDDGIEPVAPLVGIEDGEVVVKGAALFRDDRYVGKLTIQESKLLLLMRGKVKKSDLVIKIPQETGYRTLYFTYNHSKAETKVKKKGTEIEQVDIHVSMVGSLLEDTGTKINGNSSTDNNEVQKLIDGYLSNEAVRLIEILKEKKADSLGIKGYVRNSLTYQEWKKIKEEDLFQKIPINVTFSVILQNKGMLE